MADEVQSNIRINIDSAAALANLKNLQRQISAFHTSMAKGSATAAAQSAQLQQSLINSINATGKFSASMKTVKTSTESFTEALEKNKMSMGQYFKYAGAATKTFGKLFTSEFDTIEKVARERVKTLQTQYIKMGRDANGAMKAISVRPLMLDMDNLATKTAIAAQKQQILNQLLKQGSTNLLNFGKNTQWAGRQLMVGFTVPLTMLGSVAAKTFMQLEEQAIRFKRVYGEIFTSTEETDAMVKQIQMLSKEFTKYGVSVEKTMKLAADAAASGKMGADLLAQVTEATRLAVLGGVEQEQALETTISLTNAFGISAEQLAGKINFLNAVENQTVTSIEDLTIAIPKAGPVIQQLGGNVEDLAFFLTAMKEGGINASEGANALKSGLASMINPTAKASEFLQGFGINLKGIVEANKGNVKGTVIEFAKALDTLDPLNRARAIEQLFGKFQFARLSTLFKNVVDEGTQASRVLGLARATTEELAILSERELKRVEDSPMYKFKKSIEDIKAALAPVGEAFLKAVTPVIEFGTKILEKFNNLDEGTKSFVIGLTAVVAGLGPVLIMTFGLLANGVANIIKGFTAVRGLFQRTGQQSQTLGSQTEYMTQQQLEAASVAASLDQVHSKLIQTFTSEASAVGNLAMAYEQALIAQSRFSGSGAISRTKPGGQKPTGYKNGGVVMVPGKGNKDTVPAMLTPGEAVIPKDMVKKYGPLIQGMIAGNIPGHNQGLIDAAVAKASGNPESIRLLLQKEFGQLSSQTAETVELVTGHLRNFIGETEKITARKIQEFLRSGTGQNLRQLYSANAKRQAGRGGKNEDFAHVEDSRATTVGQIQKTLLDNPNNSVPQKTKEELALIAKYAPNAPARVTSALGFAQDAGINRDMKDGKAVSTDRFLKDFEGRGSVKWADAAAKAGLQMEAISGELKIYDDALTVAIREFKEISGNASITSDDFARIEKEVRTRLAPQIPVVAKSFGELAEYAGEIRYTLSEKQAKLAGLKIGQNAQGNKVAIAPDGTEVPLAKARPISKGTGSKGFGFKKNDVAEREAKVAGEKTAQAYVDGERKVASKEENDLVNLSRSKKRNSPHPQAAIDGEDDAKAYNAARAKVQGKTPQSGAQPKTKDQLAQESRTRLYGSGPIDSQQKSLRRQSEKLLRDEERLLKQKERLIKESKKNLYQTEGQVTQAMRWERKAREAKAKLLAQQQTQAMQEASLISQESVVTKKQGILNRIQSSILAAKDRLLTKERIQKAKESAASGGIGRFGKIGMAASAITMAGSMMPGKVGETAQKLSQFTLYLSAASTVLEAIPPGFKLAAVMIAALAASVIYATHSFNKAQDDALAFGEALGSGTKNIQDLSKAAGKVSAGEVMDRRRKDAFKVLPIQPGKSTFGESFMQMDAGKSMLANVKKSISSGGTKQAMLSLSEQLQTAVLSGAMSTEQAKSVAANVAEALGDRKFGLDVIANITELVGPNGEKLDKDPLGVSMKLVQQNVQQTSASATGLAKAGAVSLKDVGSIAGAVLAGAGIGYKVGEVSGAAIGAVLGAETGPGAVATAAAGSKIGAAAGTVIGGVTGGITAYADRGKRIGTATGAAVAADQMALEQNQQILDAFDLQYEKKINELRLQGKINEAVALENRYYAERQTLVAGVSQTKQQILDSLSGLEGDVKSAYLSGMEKATKKKYKGTLFEDMVPEAQQRIQDSGLGETQQAALKIELMTGGMDPLQVIKFFELFNEPGTVEKGMELVTRFGGKFATASMQILNSFVDKNGKPIKSLQTKYIQQIVGKTDKEAAEFQDFFNRIASYQNIVDVNVVASYALKNPAAQQSLENTIEQINKKNGKLSLTADAKVIGAEALSVLNQDAAYFDSLTEQEQKTLVASIVTQFSIEGTKEAQAAYKLWQGESKDNNGKSYAQMAVAKGKKLIADQRDTSTGVGTDTSGSTGGGGGPQASSLDELVKKIRDVRKASTELTIGWQQSMTAINKLFGGNKSLTLFNGLENQLRKLGAGEDLISLIAGMPPEEFEKQKNKLFTIKNGNITGLKDAAKSIGDALRSVALGDFVSKQQQVAANFKAQTTAVTKLTAAGLSAGQAYEVVQDATLAAAIANKNLTDKELKTIVTTATAAAKAMKLLAANTELAKAAAERQDQGDMISFLAKNSAGLNSDQIATVMGNKDLQTKIMLEPNMKPEDLKKLIADTASSADLELTLKSFNVEGLNEIFNGIYDRAMEWFSRQENAIQLKFEADTKADNDIITSAENKIARIEYLMDDYEAGLQDIEDQETKINESYDKTIEALDTIKDANQDILSLQKSQLGVAEALTQGDIAAAARAAQEMSQQEATLALENQRKAIEAQRKADLGAVTTVANIDGVKQTMTREQLEKQIAKYKKDIFKLEEDSVEPARERVRQATILRDNAIEALSLDGKSKDEWTNIASQVGLAEVNSTKYLASVTGVEGIVQKIQDKWTELNGKTYSTTYQIIENTIKKVTGGTPAETPKPGATVTATDNVKTTGTAGAGTGGGGGSSSSATDFKNSPGSTMVLPNQSGNVAKPKADSNWWNDILGGFSQAWNDFVNQPWVKSLVAMVVGTYNIFIKPIVDGIVNAWNGLVESVKTAWNTFTGWFDTYVIQPIVTAWNTVSTWVDTNVIQPIIAAWNSVATWVDTNVIQPINNAWNSVVTWVTDNVITPIQEAFSGFFDWFFKDDTLENKIKDVEKWWKDVITNVQNWWNDVVQWFKDLPQNIGKAVGDLWAGVLSFGDWLADRWDDAAKWFGNLGQEIGKLAGNIWSGIQGMGDWIAEQWNNVVNWFKDLPTKIAYTAGYIWGEIQKLPDWLAEQWGNVVTWFQQLPAKIAEIAGNIWNGIKGIGEWLGQQWNNLVTWFTVTLPTALAQWGAAFWSGLQSVGTWLAEQWNALVTWFTVTLPTAIAEWGAAFWSGIQAVGTWLAEQWNALVTWFTVTLPNAIAEWGAAFWSGLQAVGAWLAEQWNALVTWFTVTLPNAIKEWGAAFWNGIQAVGTWLAQQWTNLMTWFTVTLPNAVRKWASDFWGGIQDLGAWLGTKLTELKNWFTSLPGLVAQWVKGLWDGFWASFKVPQWITDIISAFKIGETDSKTGKKYDPKNATQNQNNGGAIHRSIGGGVPGIGNGDVVSAMLTPGEYVIRKEAVQKYGLDMMSKINAGQFKLPTLRDPQFSVDDMSVSTKSGVAPTSNSVYNNYNLNVNVKSDANADEIARTVMTQIRQVNAQQIRGVRL